MLRFHMAFLQNFETSPGPEKKAMTTTSVQSIWLLLLDDTLRNPIARCTRCKNLRYARIAWEILRRNFIQSKLSTNWSPREDQGATTGLLCVLQNGSPIFHNFLDTMLTQNTWCWWAGGVPWGHYFVGSNPHGCYHFVGVPIPFCKGVGWAPYTLVCPTSRSEFQGGSKMSVSRTAARSPVNTWQPSHVYASLDQTCHLNMPTWAWAEQLHAPRWTARSHLRRFGTNMPLKHAKMSMSRTAARSSLKYLTARSRLCRVRANIHLNMPPWAWAEHLTLPAEYLTARSRLCRFPANMACKHANMSVSRTASQHMQNTISIHKEEKSHLEPSVPLRAQIDRNRRQSEDRSTRRASEPTFLCSHEHPFTWKKHHVSCKSRCITSNAICQKWLAKRNHTRKTALQNKYSSRSVDAAFHCDLHRHNRIAT